MKKLVLLLVLSFLWQSCRNNVDNQQDKLVISKGLLSPVYMQTGKTQLITTDYLLHPADLDSVSKSDFFSVKISARKDTIHIFPNKSFHPVENLRLYAKGTFVDIPLFKSTKKEVVIRLPKTPEYKKVQFKSQIVGWQTLAMQQDKDYWYYKTELDPGNYQYLFVVDGKEILDPNIKDSVSNGSGGYNSLLRMASKGQKAFLQTETQDRTSFKLSTTKAVEKVFLYVDNQRLSDNNIEIKTNEISIKLPDIHTKRSYVRIYAYNDAGLSNDVLIPLQNGKIITDTQALTRRDFHTQIMYFMMVDRFYNGDKQNDRPVKSDSVLPKVNFKGGDIQGILHKLQTGYFKDLGVNTLWLSPILKNPEAAYGYWPNPPTKFSAYHGYWPVSNIKIDDRFGNETALKNLLDEAHQNEMNILLDYVANHVHKDHLLYKQHPDWFTSLYLPDGTMNTEKWDSHRLTTWFDTFLPTIDFSKHQVVEKMTDSAMFWLQKFDLDGFRHDATKHIQLDYWRTLTHKIKTKVKRPVYQIGETYGSPQLIRSYVNSGMLDGQFNFNLYDASVAVFAKDDEPVQRLADALQEALTYYGQHNLMGNITGNQDRVRFISYASGDVKFDEDGKKAGWTRELKLSDTTAYKRLEILHAFNLCIPGIPCIYYGDEYGMPGANDPDNRRMMQFEGLDKHQQDLKQKVKELIKMRSQSMALLYGSTEVETDHNVLIIKRKYFDDSLVLIINKSKKEYKYKDKSVPAGAYLIIR